MYEGGGHHFYFRQWDFSMKSKFPSHLSPVSASKCAGTMRTSCRNKIIKKKKEEPREMTKMGGREEVVERKEEERRGKGRN